MHAHLLALASLLASAHAACGANPNDIGSVKATAAIAQAADGTLISFDGVCAQKYTLSANHCDWDTCEADGAITKFHEFYDSPTYPGSTFDCVRNAESGATCPINGSPSPVLYCCTWDGQS